MSFIKILKTLPFYEGMLNVYSKIITRLFHQLYYNRGKRTWQNTFWFGTPLLKCPLDLWIYQEIIYETRPDVIIECGTHEGGSAQFLAYLLDKIGNGRIITIDIKASHVKPPHHDRINYIIGSSIDDTTVEKARQQIKPNEKVLVILDSDHSRDHVYQELLKYGPLVSKGSYMIVEDSNIGGYPALKSYGPGPMEAINRFLADSRNDNFMVDDSKEKFYLTFNPKGYLKKIK
jgi:cephalosporin hydroxylase